MPKKRKTAKGKDRKKHEFTRQNAKGNNDTKPIKWTEQKVFEEVDGMLQRLYADGEVGGTFKILFKWQLLQDKPYSQNHLAELVKEYSDNKKITYTVEKIDEILAGRAWLGGVRGNLNSVMTKFHLINNHGAREVEKVEVSGRMDNTLQIREILKRSAQDDEETEEDDE